MDDKTEYRMQKNKLAVLDIGRKDRPLAVADTGILWTGLSIRWNIRFFKVIFTFKERRDGIYFGNWGWEIFFKNFKNIFDNLISIGYYIEESLIACVSAFSGGWGTVLFWTELHL